MDRCLLDETGTLTLGDVHAVKDRLEARSTRAGFGFHAGTLWVRLRPHNPAPHIWSRWLVSDIDRQEKDVAHVVREDGTVTAATQITETPARRPGGRTVFPVELGAGESATIYIAYSGQATTVLNLNFWLPIAYLRHVENITAARYFLMGLAVMMEFSCAIAALLRRAPGLLSGAAAVALALAYTATRDGFGNYVGKSRFGLDQQQILQITAILFVGSLAAFVRSFLALDGKSPWLRRLLRGLSIIAAPLALVPLWRSTPQLAVYFSGVAVAAITLSVVANAVRGGAAAPVPTCWDGVFSSWASCCGSCRASAG